MNLNQKYLRLLFNNEANGREYIKNIIPLRANIIIFYYLCTLNAPCAHDGDTWYQI